MTALFYLVLAFTLAAVFISGWAFGITWERGSGAREQRPPTQQLKKLLLKLAKVRPRRPGVDVDRDGQS